MMNARIFHTIIAKERHKIAALPPISPAASAQLAKVDKVRRMSKMVKAQQPTQAPVSKPSTFKMMPSEPTTPM